MNAVKTTLNSLFSRHLFVTNVVSCGSLLAVGDCVVQTIERGHGKRAEKDLSVYDFERTGRMFLIGLILGPFNHHWYRLLDKYVTGFGINVVLKKVACDQIIAGPFFCTAFLIGSGLLEGKTLQACGKEWKQKFLTIYLADWCVWPPAQIINFYFLPSHLRVLYVSVVALCWNSFLSFIKHRGSEFTENENNSPNINGIKTADADRIILSSD